MKKLWRSSVKRDEIEHTLRAAGDIMDETQFIIVGSQSILGKFPDAPDELLMSAEVDMYSKNKPLLTEKLNAIGVGSQFEKTNGYYVDPVDEGTAILPKGWKSRLVNLKSPATNGITGLCLDPHDLFVSKMAANREKDVEYCRVMIEHNLIGKDRVLELAATIKNPAEDPELSNRTLKKIQAIYQGVDISKTIHVNSVNGFYTGKIISVTDTVVQQDAGRGKMIFHEASKLDQQPIIGRSYEIRYHHGIATVKRNEKENKKDHTL